MLKVKIKSFNDAVQAAIESGKEDDVIISDDKSLKKFDSLFGINRNWSGWGNILEVGEIDDARSSVVDVYYYDGEFYFPSYCVEYVTED